MASVTKHRSATPSSALAVTSLALSLGALACTTAIVEDDPSGCPTEGLLETFISPEGLEVFVYADGTLHTNTASSCTFVLQYFDPAFLEDNYITDATGTFLIADGGGLFPTKNAFFDDFESYASFSDLFIRGPTDTDLYWNTFTLQSPAAPDVSAYVALRKCILAGTCTFIDNRIDLATDPTDASNQVVRFESVPPSATMVTAKASMASLLGYYLVGSAVWYQADYYIVSGMPFSLVDFENSYFLEGPGPRVVIRGNGLAIENKFGAKINYGQTNGVPVPLGQWFTVKVHLRYSNQTDGIIELWQDGDLLISARGINLPTANSVQNRVEVGVSATSTGSVMLMDNMRVSDSPF